MKKLSKKINVAILDDHPSVIDGYKYRLQQNENISVIASAEYADELMLMIESHLIDILILDVSVPVSKINSNPYPIVNIIEEIKIKYPQILILVISMYSQRALINSLMKAGASGYLVKDDSENIHNLSNILVAISTGGVFFSQNTFNLLNPESIRKKIPELSTKMMNVLSLAAAHPNYRMEDIAEILNMAPSTVRNTFSRMYARLEVKNRTAAISKAQQLGLIPPSFDDPIN